MSYHLFQRFGVELEYMIVDRKTLAVRPIADHLLKAAAALPGAAVESEADTDTQWPGSVSLGEIGFSNELCLHVVEIKTAQPAPDLTPLPDLFRRGVETLNTLLRSHDAMLLPTGMHPTMNPDREMVLWPHDYSEVYRKFNQIHDCRGHGWANLQACHLNLPFTGDDAPNSEFGRLHAALRLLLPILPALAASTPVMNGRFTGLLDSRLEVYRTNSTKVPAATGDVIPEPVYTRRDYEDRIFAEIYRQYEPFDPEGTLRDEWANSRGAIARFGRGAIEVRVLDMQESPLADLAVCWAITTLARAITAFPPKRLDPIREFPTARLVAILARTTAAAETAELSDPDYPRLLGVDQQARTAGDLWRHLADRYLRADPAWRFFGPPLSHILEHGSLSSRIARALGAPPGHAGPADPALLAATLRRLAEGITGPSLFAPPK